MGFPVDHRLWTEVLAVAGRTPSVREAFAASDKAIRAAFVELLCTAALAGEIDNMLDFEAVSVCALWLAALLPEPPNDPTFNLEKQWEVFEMLIRRALCPAQS